jgi:hypothetical protein
MYLQKVISKKTFDVLKVTDENSRIRILIRINKSEDWISGSGSVPKCHGSATLVFSCFKLLRVVKSYLVMCVRRQGVYYKAPLTGYNLKTHLFHLFYIALFTRTQLNDLREAIL